MKREHVIEKLVAHKRRTKEQCRFMTNAALEKECRFLERSLSRQRHEDRQMELQARWLAKCAPPKEKYPFPSRAVASWLILQQEEYGKNIHNQAGL